MKIYLVDDSAPETVAVFSSLEKAIEFADTNIESKGIDRIRVGELDSPDWPPTIQTYSHWLHEWKKESR